MSLCKKRKLLKTKINSFISIKRNNICQKNFKTNWYKYGLHQYWGQAQQYLVPLWQKMNYLLVFVSHALGKAKSILKVHGTIRNGKDNIFSPARFEQNLFYPRKCLFCDKREFATKQRKMYFTTCMSKIRLSHIYRGNK